MSGDVATSKEHRLGPDSDIRRAKAGGPLADGQLDDCVVMCPLHGNVYDVETGAARNGTAPVVVYPVRSEAGVVTVTVPTH